MEYERKQGRQACTSRGYGTLYLRVRGRFQPIATHASHTTQRAFASHASILLALRAMRAQRCVYVAFGW